MVIKHMKDPIVCYFLKYDVAISFHNRYFFSAYGKKGKQIRLSPFHVSFPDFLGYLMGLYFCFAVFRNWVMGLVFIFLGGLGVVFGFGWVNLCGDKKNWDRTYGIQWKHS